MIKCQWNEKHYLASCKWTSLAFHKSSINAPQSKQIFKIFLGQHHISLVQEWVTHFRTFAHMAALTVTQTCTTYFMISSCHFISIWKDSGSWTLPAHRTFSGFWQEKCLPGKATCSNIVWGRQLRSNYESPFWTDNNGFELANIYDTILAPSRP